MAGSGTPRSRTRAAASPGRPVSQQGRPAPLPGTPAPANPATRPRRSYRWPTIGELWTFLGFALPALASLLVAMPAVDLAYQLRAGADILATGAIPTTDTWTFTINGQPWIDQQWGAQVILAAVYQTAGWTGLAILRAALVAATFALVQATLRSMGCAQRPAALLALGSFAVAAPALALRPQLFGIVLFAASMYVVADRRAHPRRLWLLPVFGALWANLHGTFLFAPALCGLAWFADLFDAAGGRRAGGEASGSKSGSRLHEMLVVGLVATLPTLVNPYGPAVWGYVANLTSNPTIASRVSEWRPASPLTVTGGLVWLSVLGVALLAAARVRAAVNAVNEAVAAGHSSIPSTGAFRAPYTLPWPALLTLVLFGGFALTSGRGTAWWPFVAVFVVAPWLQPPVARAPRPTPAGLQRINAAIVSVLILAGVALLPVWRPLGAVGVPTGVLTFAPQALASRLEVLCHPGLSDGSPVWNPQVWGSWLEFAAPCHSYATDSRIELFSAETWRDVDTVSNAAPGWPDVLARHNVGTVVTDHSTDAALEAALAAAGWSEVYRDDEGSIWSDNAAGG